jgi:hypothetical protein
MTPEKILSSHNGRKTANINSKKRQSPLNVVVIGHRRSKTAKIIEAGEGRGRGRKFGRIWKWL